MCFEVLIVGVLLLGAGKIIGHVAGLVHQVVLSIRRLKWLPGKLILVEGRLIEVIVRVEVGVEVLWDSVAMVLLRGLEVRCGERLSGGKALSGVKCSGREGVGVDRWVKA